MHRTKIGFVARFVDELYVILIGLGLANVIFGLDPLGHPSLPLLMALFVTTVVVLYWWDWKATFEDSIISNRTEFAIDLLILITLEFLFRYFDDPQRLIQTFVVLGLLDLAWVINYVVRFHQEHAARRRAWIAEKLFVILIYSVVAALIATAASAWPIPLQDAMIVVTFAIVRFVGFRQAKQASRLAFRAAVHSDATAIAEINNDHFRATGEQGFLITELDPADVSEEIENGAALYCVATDTRGDIQGFIELYLEPDQEVRESKWSDPELKHRFEKSDKLYIAKVGVSASAARLGVGRFMYSKLKEEHDAEALYAFVVLEPIRNTASVKFHESLGFQQVAGFASESFLDLSPYASALMVLWPQEANSPGPSESR